MKKNRRLRTALLWIQAGIVLFMGLLFASGFVFDARMEKVEKRIAPGMTAPTMDARLSPRIGTTYDGKLHDNIIGVMYSSDAALVELTNGSRKGFQVIFLLAGCAVFLALLSIFVIVRSPKDAAEPGEGV